MGGVTILSDPLLLPHCHFFTPSLVVPFPLCPVTSFLNDLLYDPTYPQVQV